MKISTIAVILLVFQICPAQDLIILKSGNEINGKIIKVGTSEVEYRKDSISPVYAIKKSEVFMIKYESGTKDVLADLGTTPAKNTASQETLDILKRKYEKPKRAGIGLFVTAGILLVAGSACTSVATRGPEALFWGGIGAMGASIPLFIGGGVSIRKYAKYKRQWKEQQRSLSFAPNGLRLTF